MWRWVVIAVGLGGCVESAVTVCNNGLVCPSAAACDEVHETCVLPEQLTSCAGAEDATDCMIAGDPVGVCRDAVCINKGCGDGFVLGSEQCEGEPPDERDDCLENGFHNAGPVTCSTSCTLDVSQCQGRCGDGVLDPGEACESNDTADPSDDLLGGRTCTDFGYYDVDGIGCSLACTLDVSACTGFCGDRAQDAGEVCEGKSPPGESCIDYGYESGPLGCLALCAPDFTRCERPGWTSVNTNLPTTYLTEIWAAAAGDAFVLSGQTVRRWDGAALTPMTVPSNGGLLSIWGSGSEAFVVGASGFIMRWTGSAWQQMTSGTTTTLFAVGGSSPTNVIAVGDAGEIRHYNGTSWQPMTSGTSEQLFAVWSYDANTAFVGGGGATILRWNGSTWQPMTVPLPSFQGINSIWGTAADNVYAVGNGFILRYDGVSWTEIPPPTVRALMQVWGTGPDDIYAVGYLGTIVHWDGTTWSAVTVGVADFFGVGGSGAADVLVVGSAGTLVRQRASKWSRTTTSGRLEDVWGTSANDVYATGPEGIIRHFDGSTWTPMTSNATTRFYALWGAGNDVWAAGLTSNFNGGEIYRLVTGSWQYAYGTSDFFFDLWGTAANDVWAVGGGVHHWNGSAWTQTSTEQMFAIWGASATDLFGVGGNGKIVRGNGTTWTPMTSNVPFDLDDVWGSGPDDVFAVGRGGQIVHWNGSTWTPMASGTPHEIYSVTGSGPNDVYAGEDRGAILHFDGYTWSPMESNTGESISGMWADNDVFAVGIGGSILRRPRACPAVEKDCGNDADDDCDGLVDCGDPDCASAATCGAGGMCTGHAALSCNTTVMGNTTTGVSRMTRYGCDAWLESGREVVYRVTPSTSGTVTVSLGDLVNDLDVIVLAEGAAGGCEPHLSGCLGASSTGSTADETVSFAATAGKPYYIVVDGYGASAGPFALSIACP